MRGMTRLKTLHADADLSRRLERAEAQANLDFVEARARAFPERGAEWTCEEGTFALFDGIDSPLTQTFGLGMAGPVSADGFERIEAFFERKGAPTLHEVSPLADPSTLSRLNERGYEPFEFTSILYRPSSGAPPVERPEGRVAVRITSSNEVEHWAAISARGWASEARELGDFMLELGRVSAQRASAVCFLAEIEGVAVAAGALAIHEGVALLAGASTVPEGRRRGAQQALLAARLQYAADRGCDVAMIGALPGSASQRNAERQGFRVAYTRMKWRRRSRG